MAVTIQKAPAKALNLLNFITQLISLILAIALHSVAQAQSQFGPVTVDGSIGEWTDVDRLDISPWAGVSGDRIFNQYAAGNFLLAIDSSLLSPGAVTTLYLNTDKNSSTGFKIFGFAGGVENRIDISPGVAPSATLQQYIGNTANTITVGPLQIAQQGSTLEIVIPQSQLVASPTDFNMLVTLDNGVRNLPSDFSAFQYNVSSVARPKRSEFSKRVAIVYSATTAAKYFDTKAYSQLFMSAQHQTMMAGIPFDLLTESQLLDVTNLVNYDALVFPLYSHIQSANRATIEDVLNQASYRYKIGLIAAGDFITNSETGAALNPAPYRAMNNILGITPLSGGGATSIRLVPVALTHPVMKGYAPTDVVKLYTQSQYTSPVYRVFGPIGAYPITTLVGQKLNNAPQVTTAILANRTGGRNVHFATDSYIADTNILWSGLRWSVFNSSTPVVLQMGRQKSLFFARNDMDESKFNDEFDIVEAPLLPLITQWKNLYNFVGSYYINIGNNPAEEEYTNWTRNAPYYQSMINLGSEIGNHSYTHPEDTNLLSDTEMQFEFADAKTVIQQQLGITLLGAAIPGAPDTLATALRIEQFGAYPYLTGGFSGLDMSLGATENAGFPGAFGFLTPSSNMVYFSPNMTFDFTMLDFRVQSAAQAEQIWKDEYDYIQRFASQPIVHWPWHDYGPTAYTTPNAEHPHQYSVAMYQNLIARAFQDNTEFVTGADLYQRIKSLMTSSLKITFGDPLDITVTGSGLGTFSLLLDHSVGVTQKIKSVENWYAFSDNRVFLPENGGHFVVSLGASAADVTHITELPMRARLLSLQGDGINLSYVLEGAGVVKIKLPQGLNANFIIQSAGGTAQQVGNDLTITYANNGTHSASVVSPFCGDAVVQSPYEQCDDGNTSNSDGCGSSCKIEQSYSCAGTPSVCQAGCGDGVVSGSEACDDGGLVSGDGCSSSCAIEDGYSCSGSLSVCSGLCGDGKFVAAEQCEDGNTSSNDGCSAACAVEAGYSCSGNPSSCQVSALSMNFSSLPVEDGWVRESAPAAGIGGLVTSNSSGSSALRIGDDKFNRQYKSVLSFDTSGLPDNAVILGAKLVLKRGGTTGGNPFTTFGNATVAIKQGAFGSTVGVDLEDFAASSDLENAAEFSNQGPARMNYNVSLIAQALGSISRTGRTQFRLQFPLTNNQNGTSDYAGFFPGDASNALYSPKLQVIYSLP